MNNNWLLSALFNRHVVALDAAAAKANHDNAKVAWNELRVPKKYVEKLNLFLRCQNKMAFIAILEDLKIADPEDQWIRCLASVRIPTPNKLVLFNRELTPEQLAGVMEIVNRHAKFSTIAYVRHSIFEGIYSIEEVMAEIKDLGWFE